MAPMMAAQDLESDLLSTLNDDLTNANTDEVSDAIERDILHDVHALIDDCRAGMQPRLRRWQRYYQKYRNRYKPTDSTNNTPVADLQLNKASKFVDLFAGYIRRQTVPDKHRLDFFQFTPETSEDEPVNPQMEQYEAYAASAVRNNLIDCGFNSGYFRGTIDLMVTGNMVALPIYEQKLTFRYQKIENPEFYHELPADNPLNMDKKPNGKGGFEWVPRPKFLTVRIPFCEKDAPGVRFLNPRNVFPTELDRKNLGDCTGVVIYDTVRYADLKEDEIATGGYLYANLDKLSVKDEKPNVYEVDRSHSATDDNINDETEHSSNCIKKLERYTYIGRFKVDEVVKPELLEEEGGLDAVYEKFAFDPQKRQYWNTLIIEVVNGVLVRFQPLPFMRDKNPIIHAQLFPVSNCTIAEGLYDRIEVDEAAYNFFLRCAALILLKIARPMVAIQWGRFDGKFQQEVGRQLAYRPDGVLPINNGVRLDEAVQFMQTNPQALSDCFNFMSDRERTMAELAQIPAVKQGVHSGGSTATEVSKMAENSDAILDEVAQNIEIDFLHPMIEAILQLHHQFTEETVVVNFRDEANKPDSFNIPPEVWLKNRQVNILGYRQVGNIAVRTVNFEKFSQMLQASGRGNLDKIVEHYSRLLQIPAGQQFLTEPPPPAPEVPMKGTLNVSMTGDLLPPVVKAELLKSAGQDITPGMLEQMGAIYEAQQAADELEMQNEQMQGQMNMEPGRPNDANSQQPVQPQGAKQYAPGSHHPIGEASSRRGMTDDVGIQNSMGKRFSNPANARRVQS